MTFWSSPAVLTTALKVASSSASEMPAGGLDFILTKESKEGAIAVSS